jgi:hypothetical protein
MNSPLPLNGQQAYAPPLPQPEANPSITVTLDLNVWNLILTQIVEAPYKTAAPLIEALHRQIRPAVEAHIQQHQEIMQARPGVTT